MSLRLKRAVAVAGACSLVMAPAPVAAQQTRLRAEWQAYARLFREQPGRRVTLVCPPGEKPVRVFGTDVYTDDSSVCSAAVHAGVLPVGKGGAVTIVIGRAMRAFEGSTRNGITSEKAGPYAGSFSFERDASGQVDWSTTAAGIEWVHAPLSLVCPPGGETGRVWGTDTYQGDSSICSAAVHAGRITARSGGTITIEGAGPQDGFTASDRNGVTSIRWPGGSVSFRILGAPARPDPRRASTSIATLRSIDTSALSILGAFAPIATARTATTATLALTGAFATIATTRSITTPTLAIQGQ